MAAFWSQITHTYIALITKTRWGPHCRAFTKALSVRILRSIKMRAVLRATMPGRPLRIRQQKFTAKYRCSPQKLAKIQTTVNVNGLPGHVAIAGQHQDDIRNLFNFTEAANGDAVGFYLELSHHIGFD